jgi:hypothetical protein
VGVNDIGLTEPVFCKQKSGGLCPLSKNAGVRAYDRLPVSACAQPSRQREKGFLAPAPGLFRIDVNDREWPQKMNVAFSVAPLPSVQL